MARWVSRLESPNLGFELVMWVMTWAIDMMLWNCLAISGCWESPILGCLLELPNTYLLPNFFICTCDCLSDVCIYKTFMYSTLLVKRVVLFFILGCIFALRCWRRHMGYKARYQWANSARSSRSSTGLCIGWSNQWQRQT